MFINARAAIGLLVFERFCVLHGLKLHDNQEFLEYLWDFGFCLMVLTKFEPWESVASITRTLSKLWASDEFPEDLLLSLAQNGIGESQFRLIFTQVGNGYFMG
ncbi:hypothetical protein OK016_18200 [Vibrio chagasii]|nr:hypothetical protein [Vibrio chagasii]